VALALSVLFGWIVTTRALSSVSRMTRAARAIGIHDLSSRLPLPPAKDEIHLLGSTFNELLERLESAVNRLRRFAADVSHELRTPLSVLRGEAELALRRPREADDYQQSLRTIMEESAHMTGIVENLLLLARVQARAIELTRERLDAQTWLEPLLKSVESEVTAHRATLEVEDRLSPDPLFGSPTYLSIMLKNLLLNALRHNPEGTRVLLRIEKSESQILLVVRDWGQGIPTSALPALFDPFVRGDTSRHRTTTAQGTGLGLSLVKALAQLHGGDVTCRSEVGEGTTFTITLPLFPTKESR
jgi:signal transduction histidine kinase